MLLTLKVTAAQIASAKEVFAADHAAFYGQPHGFRTSKNEDAYELFGVRLGVWEDSLNLGFNETKDGRFGWITCGGNIVMFDPSRGEVTYLGARHGISPLYVLENPQDLKVIRYESSMGFLNPFETLPRFADRASLDSDCPYGRGIALLKSGKPMQFLHAEGLPAYAIQKVHKECVARGVYYLVLILTFINICRKRNRMKIFIEIDYSNAAFSDNSLAAELSMIFSKIIDKAQDNESIVLRDSNGNSVGSFHKKD